ncbi:MAG: terminase small subunit [Magnetococcales bacterium]|nr:terminase small subunit [Magnetococcales bacterium]
MRVIRRAEFLAFCTAKSQVTTSDTKETTMVLNRAQFAELIGKSRGWVSKLMAAGMPFVPGGGKGHEVAIDSVQAIAWLIERERHKATTGEPETLLTERIRLTSAQANKAEMEVSQMSNLFVEKEAVKAVFAEAMVIIATQMDGLGGRLASELAGMTNQAEIQALLLRETRRIRATAAAKLGELVNRK